MPTLVRLILIVAVLWCGMHFAEPVDAHAHAHVDAAAHQAFQDDVAPDRDDRGSAPADVAHPGHHHCPIVPLHTPPAEVSVDGYPGAAPYPTPVPALASLVGAPPFEPPAA